MRQSQLAVSLLSAAISAAFLVGCGGGSASGGNQSTKIQYSAQVSFGDSLSDVGTYAVGAVAAMGGGKYTVNSVPASPQNWTELMAATLHLPEPCPAQTGLTGLNDAELSASPLTAPLAALSPSGFSVAVTNHAGCYGYGQGGARVTDPNGPGSAGLASGLGGSPVLGQLTVPIVTQIQNHLTAVGGKFTGKEMVFVLAGANDVFVQLATLNANATLAGQQAATAAVTAAVPGQVQSDISAGLCTPTDAQASNCVAQAITELTPTVGATAGNAAAQAYVAGPNGAQAAVQAMGLAGAQLAGYINQLIVANGANYVTVVNIPDIGTTPFGDGLSASSLQLVNTMVSTFNSQLQSGIAGTSAVLYVDANTQAHLNTQNPSQYGITNAKDPACNLVATANPLGSSLVCNASNVQSGDISHYLFADTVHPTPYGYSLLAKYVATEMAVHGWL
jgi:phospholipase/lecithinase/hemolysin